LAGSPTTTASNGTTSNVFFSEDYLPAGGPSYFQNAVTASTSNAATTFTIAQAAPNPIGLNPLNPAVTATGFGTLLTDLEAGQVLTGQAGSTGSTPIQVFVSTITGAGVPNVSVQLVSYQSASSGPVVNCAGSAGGEVNTVLTNSTSAATNGIATCSPVFSGVPGTGQYYILVGAGGIAPAAPTPVPFANIVIGPLNLSVTAAQPGLIKVIQGDGQSAAPGTTLSALQVE